MEPEEARAALDQVRLRQDQSHAEYLGYGFSRGRLLLSALIVFVSFASFDLPNPWGGAVLFPVAAVLAWQLALYVRRARVRMALTGRAAMLSVCAGAALVGLFKVLSDAADAGGVPVPHTVAGAVVCALGLLVVRRTVAGGAPPGGRGET
ncbi:hypothetical protein ACIRFH_34720 [Streptomyces sp. NPDC093586]|uniref:hypothetical protein n=1 Tax=Streptomyces sp. NPDC093586 TaxID=3366042 RepID=UPI003806778B